jgi:hypothetical protein
MASIPDLTRLIARIADWQEGHGKPEVGNMLADVRLTRSRLLRKFLPRPFW